MSARKSSKGKEPAARSMKRSPANDLVTAVQLTKVELAFVLSHYLSSWFVGFILTDFCAVHQQLRVGNRWDSEL